MKPPIKPAGLDLPPEIANQIADAQQWSGPSSVEQDRLRGRLQWAFVNERTTNSVTAIRKSQLREVPGAAQPSASAQRWWTIAARAAAALVLAHVPLALATLGVVVAAVPVTRSLLAQQEHHPVVSHPSVRTPRVGGPGLRPTPPSNEVNPSTESGKPTPWVALPLAPVPGAFPVLAEPPRVPQSAFESEPPPAALHPPEPVAAFATLAPDKGAALATERELLELARRALLHDDPTGALADLEQHRRHYPDSQLSEEREALSIQALLRTGQTGEARLRDAEFRRRFPSSLLLPALDAALRPPLQ